MDELWSISDGLRCESCYDLIPEKAMFALCGQTLGGKADQADWRCAWTICIGCADLRPTIPKTEPGNPYETQDEPPDWGEDPVVRPARARFLHNDPGDHVPPVKQEQASPSHTGGLAQPVETGSGTGLPFSTEQSPTCSVGQVRAAMAPTKAEMGPAHTASISLAIGGFPVDLESQTAKEFLLCYLPRVNPPP